MILLTKDPIKLILLKYLWWSSTPISLWFHASQGPVSETWWIWATPLYTKELHGWLCTRCSWPLQGCSSQLQSQCNVTTTEVIGGFWRIWVWLRSWLWWVDESFAHSVTNICLKVISTFQFQSQITTTIITQHTLISHSKIVQTSSWFFDGWSLSW